jgi:hypothetical protein
VRAEFPVDGAEEAKNTKGRSLGERPAFLMSPPGCGVTEALGVWEGGFDERLGEPLAGIGKLGFVWRAQGAADLAKILSDMNYNKVTTSLMSGP